MLESRTTLILSKHFYHWRSGLGLTLRAIYSEQRHQLLGLLEIRSFYTIHTNVKESHVGISEGWFTAQDCMDPIAAKQLERDLSNTKSIAKCSELLLVCRQNLIHFASLAVTLLRRLDLAACETTAAGVSCFVLGLVGFLFNSPGFLVILLPHSPAITSTSSAANTLGDFIQWSDAASLLTSSKGKPCLRTIKTEFQAFLQWCQYLNLQKLWYTPETHFNLPKE